MKAIRALLFCPRCKSQHVDEGEWVKRSHETHRCVDRIVRTQTDAHSNAVTFFVEPGCGFEWRPMLVPSVGVLELNEKGVRA